jgi:beta-glucosidase
VATETVEQGAKFEIKVKIRNTGAVAGKEVIQLYVSDLEASLPRPVKELKGFKKVALQPGEEQEVSFFLTKRDLAFYDPYQKTWVAEPGEFELLVGFSAQDIREKCKVTLR